MSTNSASPQTKTVVVTALISAVSTIAVSLIAVLPALKAEKSTPSVLQEQKKVGEPRWRIEGKVLNGGASDQVGAAQLFLLRTDSLTQTDDGGKFAFDRVPEGTYLIQVEVGDAQGKRRSNRFLIGPSTDADDELKSDDGGPSIEILGIGPATHE